MAKELPLGGSEKTGAEDSPPNNSAGLPTLHPIVQSRKRTTSPHQQPPPSQVTAGMRWTLLLVLLAVVATVFVKFTFWPGAIDRFTSICVSLVMAGFGSALIYILIPSPSESSTAID